VQLNRSRLFFSFFPVVSKDFTANKGFAENF
jgi:hypothetical protein